MEELKSRFPDGLDYRIVYDTTPFIRDSVNEVFYMLRDAVILVAIVVLLFLQDWRAMILPMIDVPVSLIGTFAVMAAMGFTINNLTLFGLVLAIGIVVDDAIVVLENIERQMATGLDARSATIKAMHEITGPILAITLVLSAVFIPCCFLGGVTGHFFRQFAVTIAVSTVISAINAVTMTPSRAAMIFKTEEDAAGHKLQKEAVPWWLFGILGGMLTIWLGQRLIAPRFFPPANPAIENASSTPWAAYVLYFIPGEQQREAGVPTHRATTEAVRLRLRPILMTSFAFILGVVPLVIARGAGAEMRRTLGVAVFSGMLGVTIFGVFLTPLFYYAIQSFNDRRARHSPTMSIEEGGNST